MAAHIAQAVLYLEATVSHLASQPGMKSPSRTAPFTLRFRGLQVIFHLLGLLYALGKKKKKTGLSEHIGTLVKVRNSPLQTYKLDSPPPTVLGMDPKPCVN